jgi:TM2 domain-containing membrane protein YozV
VEKPLVAFPEFTGRRVTAVILSTIIPGTGQTYLGDKAKGAAITLLTFGSVLTAVLSQNNLVARNERIQSLEYEYNKTASYDKADRIYRQMLEARDDAESDYKRRNLFTGISIGLWVVNMVDVILFTADSGEKEFTQRSEQRDNITVSLSVVNTQPMFSLHVPLR